jgi:hypothetical protein
MGVFFAAMTSLHPLHGFGQDEQDQQDGLE